jgi:hypothetical protein
MATRYRTNALCSSSKKSKVQSAGLAPDILRGLMPITTETEPEDIEDEAPSRVSITDYQLVSKL